MHWTDSHPDRRLWSPGRLAQARGQTREEYETLYGRGEGREAPLRPLSIRDQLAAYQAGSLLRSERRAELQRLRQEAQAWQHLSARSHWADAFSDEELLGTEHPSALLHLLAKSSGQEYFAGYLFEKFKQEQGCENWWSEEIMPQLRFVAEWSPGLAHIAWKQVCQMLGVEDNLLRSQAELLEILQRSGDRERVREFAETPVLASGPIAIHVRAAELLDWGSVERSPEAVEISRVEAEIWWQGFCGIARGSTRCSDPDLAWHAHREGGPSPLLFLGPFFHNSRESLERLVQQTASLFRSAQASITLGTFLEEEFRCLRSTSSADIVYRIQQTALRHLA